MPLLELARLGQGAHRNATLTMRSRQPSHGGPEPGKTSRTRSAHWARGPTRSDDGIHRTHEQEAACDRALRRTASSPPEATTVSASTGLPGPLKRDNRGVLLDDFTNAAIRRAIEQIARHQSQQNSNILRAASIPVSKQIQAISEAQRQQILSQLERAIEQSRPEISETLAKQRVQAASSI